MKDTTSAEINRAVTSDETYPVEDKALALAQLKKDGIWGCDDVSRDV